MVGVVGPALVRFDKRDVDPQLEPAAQRGINRVIAKVLVPVAAPFVGEGEREEPGAEESSLEGVDPATPRCTSASGRRLDVGLVPAVREKRAESERPPARPGGLGVGVAEERLINDVRERSRQRPTP